jgi:hypothetical protein
MKSKQLPGRARPAGKDTANKMQQGVDKAPGEERDRGEKVTKKDLKGKQVDADIFRQQNKPVK